MGEIRIHRAFTWLENSKDGGWQDYKNFQNQVGMRRAIRTLIARQVARRSTIPKELGLLRKVLTELNAKREFIELAKAIERVLRKFADGSVNDAAA